MSNAIKELLSLYRDKKFALAEKKCSKLIQRAKPNYELLNLHAILLFELKKYDHSILQLEKSLKINPNYHQGYNSLGNVYFKKNDFQLAIVNFDKALGLKPDYFEAISNKANVYFKQKKYELALKNYNQVLSINDNFQNAYEGRAKIFKIIQKFDEAIVAWKKVVELDPTNDVALTQLGDLYFDKNKLDLAIEYYEKAIKINPDKDFLIGNIILTKTKMCDWENLDKYLKNLKKDIISRKKISPPYPNLTFFDDPKLHYIAAEVWSKEHISNENLSKIKFKQKKDKIKLGYFSADFRTHAMGHLMVKMLEQHDRSKFEIYGFYFGPKINSNDELSKRILKCFDKFVDISLIEDLEVAKISREIGLDIAVDFMCYTGNYNRFGVFTKRCAPLQVNFLGYPGTSGSKFIDYIILDKKIICDENKEHFSENLIIIPDTYQPNEDEKKTSLNFNSKEELGLPKDKFIFACFNSHQKILPDMFNNWIEILKEKEDSVLWLLKDNDYSEKNLNREIEKGGVSKERLIFANHIKLEDHLARLKFVDLFLDTFPYNAHTTCSDALRMGIPVLTMKGKSFASRVANSLLSTMNLSELIVEDNKEFVKKAIKISNNFDELKLLKEKVKKNKIYSNLFKSETFTKNLEKHYLAIYKNLLDGNEPKNFEL